MKKSSWLMILAVVFACETADDIETGPEQAFVKFYGVEGNQEAVDMLVGADGHVYLLGNSAGRTARQAYLVKTTPAGLVVWQRTYGGGRPETAKDIEQTADGRLVVVADALTPAGDSDVKIRLINAVSGAVTDSVVYRYSGFDEEAASVSPITDGFIVSGSTRLALPDPNTNLIDPNNVHDGILLRFNADLTPYTGNWVPQLGLGTEMEVRRVLQEGPDLYTVFSNTNSRNINTTRNNDFYILSINNQGQVLNGVFFGTPAEDEVITAMAKDPISAAYAVSGVATNAAGRKEILYLFISNTLAGGTLRKITSNLAQTQPEITIASAITAFGSGLFVTAATQNRTEDLALLHGDWYLTMIDRQGNALWTNPPAVTFGGVANDFIAQVAEAPDQKIMLFGTMGIGDVQGQRKMALIKLNREGKFAP
jgi:hypothetical protein